MKVLVLDGSGRFLPCLIGETPRQLSPPALHITHSSTCSHLECPVNPTANPIMSASRASTIASNTSKKTFLLSPK